MRKATPSRKRKLTATKPASPAAPDQPALPKWSRFLKSRCSGKYDLRSLLALNIVNVSVRAPATSLDCVKAVAAGAVFPIPIDHLDSALGKEPSIRGQVFLKALGDTLNDIAICYQDMIWWISDAGLVMKIVEPPPSTDGLSAFDRIAGAKVPTKSSGERLSKVQLESIVAELDVAGVKLKENLQPAQWEKIAYYNQTHQRASIQTFQDALGVGTFSTFVRRRLYVARDNYARATAKPKRHLEKFDAHRFHAGGLIL